jgi:hypothetical protein
VYKVLSILAIVCYIEGGFVSSNSSIQKWLMSWKFEGQPRQGTSVEFNSVLFRNFDAAEGMVEIL